MSHHVEPLCIAADHPSLAGHFPGAPVVPGVVLLDAVASSLQRAGAGRFVRLGAVKFLSPLGPDQAAELHWLRDGSRVRFRILRADAIILSGDGELA